jgi:hypothetical protein
MCRIVPPPLGVGHVCIADVAGSNRTSMFFVSTPVWQYRMIIARTEPGSM